MTIIHPNQRSASSPATTLDIPIAMRVVTNLQCPSTSGELVASIDGPQLANAPVSEQND